MIDSELKERLIQVPHEKLAKEALIALIEEYVTRDGTDYGLEETSLENKTLQVLNQIKSGDLKICFDPETEEVDICLADDISE